MAITRLGTYSQIKGSVIKLPVRVSTTGDVNLSAGNCPTVVDGITLNTKDRILVSNQITQKNNGIYIVSSSGTWVRDIDMSNSSDFFQGVQVSVNSGLTGSNKLFSLSTPDPIILDTTPIIFTQIQYGGSSGIVTTGITGYEYQLSYEHPLGSSEYVGDSNYNEQYTTGARGIGVIYLNTGSTTEVKKIETRMWGDAASAGEIRVYYGYNANYTGNNNLILSATTLAQSWTFTAGNHPNQDSGSTLTLILDNSGITVPANNGLWVLQVPTAGVVYERIWSTSGSTVGQRRRIAFTVNSGSTTWTSSWTYGATGYEEVPMRLWKEVAVTGITSSGTTSGSGTSGSSGISGTSGISGGSTLSNLVVPSNIYVAVNRELNIWKDALQTGNNIIEFSGTKGKNMEICFIYTGLSGDTGTTTTITVYANDRNNSNVETKTFSLRPVSRTVGSGTKQMLFIGDSLTAGGNFTQEMNNLIGIDGSGITALWLGTQGTPPNRHEGHSGWSFNSFIIAGSPFYIGGRLDFKSWMSTNSYFTGSDRIDYIFIMLGINDVFSGTKTQSDINDIIGRCKTLLSGATDATYGYPSAKIILSLPPIGGNTSDGFANNYGASTQRQQYEANMRLLWKSMITNFDNNAFASNVYLNSAGLWVDRTYGYDLTSTAISARYTTTTPIHTNGVHPTTSGYNQLVDSFYSTLRYLLP